MRKREGLHAIILKQSALSGFDDDDEGDEKYIDVKDEDDVKNEDDKFVAEIKEENDVEVKEEEVKKCFYFYYI